MDALDDGLGGGRGEIERVGSSGGGPNTCESAGRDLSFDCVGMVRRRAAVFDEGVEGRVGGTLKSWIRLLEPFCDFAFEAAVGSSYRDLGWKVGTSNEFRDPCFEVSITDKEAFRVNLRTVEGGVGGLSPECDFWPLKLPGLGVKKLLDGEGDGDGIGGGAVNVWKVCDLEGGLRGGEGESRSFCNWRAEEGGGCEGDLDRSNLARDGGRSAEGRDGGWLLLRLRLR